MTVRDQEFIMSVLPWTCKNTSKKLKDEASLRLDCLSNKKFTLLHNGNIVHGNTCVRSVRTSIDNPLIAITDRTKKSKNL